jgi:hypothetical protein
MTPSEVEERKSHIHQCLNDARVIEALRKRMGQDLLKGFWGCHKRDEIPDEDEYSRKDV